MTFKELFEEEEFKEIFSEIDAFAHNKLDNYIERLKKQKLSKGNKEIFDAVWGNIEFSNGEIYILDSPLLQRLRKIKQLGLAYFVYCGSDYSRFYHTIGVAYLADRMATTINRCELGMSDERKEYFRGVIRLAALFHDAGHMFLSHVSEHYFAKSPLYPRISTVEKMLSLAKPRTKNDSISLHELLSCMIVNTESVKELLKCVADYFDVNLINQSNSIEDLIEYMSCLIVGTPVDRYILPYSSIINGPIDADKCDYLSRDSHVTRVPVAVDISRITQKLSVVEKNDITMSEMWHEDAEIKKDLYVLAMEDSAEKALFQLCIARTIMFDSVYYHHKVLTAETEFRNVLNKLANLDKPLFTNFTEILEYSDEDFNRYFFESLRKEREEADCVRLNSIQNEVQAIYNRELSKRIVCLMPEYLEGTQDKKEALFDDMLTNVDSNEECEFIEDVKDEYIYLCKILEKNVPSKEDINILTIKAPTLVNGHSKIQVPIDLRNGNKREFRGYELVSSRETSSSASYIVTGEEERILVLLALQITLFRKYDIQIKEEAFSCGKYERKEFLTIYKQLLEKGYYNNIPQFIPDELLFNMGFSKNKVSELVEKYSVYEGPEGYKITEKQVKGFFKQIMACCEKKRNCRDILDGVYRLLSNAIFINREYVSKYIDKLLEQVNHKKDTLYIVPLGGLNDSAKHMMYYFNDRKEKQYAIEMEKTLEELLNIPDIEHIVFFDDGAFSGTQVVSIMQEYMGLETKTDEHHVETLQEELREIFCEKSVTYIYIVFNGTREEDLKRELQSIGLGNVRFVYAKDISTKWLEENENTIFENKTQREMVQKLLRNIGYSILKSTKAPEGQYKNNWNEERIQEASLGYNDAQQMVFLKSSIPTYTITAFWAEGDCNGFHWNPLFRRTDK